MCGILAYIVSSEIKNNKETVIKQSVFLEKRGPDNSVIIDNGDLFIFYRLSINDVSEKGNQPMQKNNIIMMCNGEIYNHKELQKRYNIECKSNSDCEIILELYDRIGFINTIKELYGVFAIILSDDEKVYFSRDRIGVRPLYIGYDDNNDLTLSSLPNCLLFCSNIEQVKPGTSFCYNKITKQLELLYYDELIYDCIKTSNSDMLKEALIKAVEMRLMSDRPMGCLLSGGLDSSIITAILVKFLGGHNVRTYSVGMEGSTDMYFAKIVANYLGTKHTEVFFTPEEGFNIIPEVIECIGSYDITTIRASVGMYIVSKYISKNTNDKVIFSGEGSDELLQGYLYFHKAPSIEEGNRESHNLVTNLYLYDVLRADRCISNNGLEPRVPFLDRKVVDTIYSLPEIEKRPYNNIEKYILRKAFEDWLPSEIIWRRKEAFSDGVSSTTKSWYSYIQERIGGDTKQEGEYYKKIFTQIFGKYDTKTPYWMPKWSNTTDPSARLLK